MDVFAPSFLYPDQVPPSRRLAHVFTPGTSPHHPTSCPLSRRPPAFPPQVQAGDRWTRQCNVAPMRRETDLPRSMHTLFREGCICCEEGRKRWAESEAVKVPSPNGAVRVDHSLALQLQPFCEVARCQPPSAHNRWVLYIYLLCPDALQKKPLRRSRLCGKSQVFTHTVHAQSTHTAEKVLFFAPHLRSIRRSRIRASACGVPWLGVDSVPRP
jgi:hypothetical protein